MRSALILAAILLALPARGQTLSAQGGNLPPNFYPPAPCAMPDRSHLAKPPESSNQQALQLYNFRVRAFNQKVEAFNACMKDYVARAQKDIDAIQATVHAAVLKANTL